MKCLVIIALVAACYATPYLARGGVMILVDHGTIDIGTTEKEVTIGSELTQSRSQSYRQSSRGDEKTVIIVRDQNTPTRRIVIDENNQIVQDIVAEESDLPRNRQTGKGGQSRQVLILEQLVEQYQGVVDQQTFRQILNKVQAAVETGAVHPVVLEVLLEIDESLEGNKLSQIQLTGQRLNPFQIYRKTQISQVIPGFKMTKIQQRVGGQQLSPAQEIALQQLTAQIGQGNVMQLLNSLTQRIPLTTQQMVALQLLSNSVGQENVQELLAQLSKTIRRQQDAQDLVRQITGEQELTVQKRIALVQLQKQIGEENSWVLLKKLAGEPVPLLQSEALKDALNQADQQNIQEILDQLVGQENQQIPLQQILDLDTLGDKQKVLMQELVSTIGPQQTKEILTQAVTQQGLMKYIAVRKLAEVIGQENAQELINEITTNVILGQNVLRGKQQMILQELINQIGQEEAQEQLTQAITQQGLLKQIALQQLAQVIGVGNTQDIVNEIALTVSQIGQRLPVEVIQQLSLEQQRSQFGKPSLQMVLARITGQRVPLNSERQLAMGMLIKKLVQQSTRQIQQQAVLNNILSQRQRKSWVTGQDQQKFSIRGQQPWVVKQQPWTVGVGQWQPWTTVQNQQLARPTVQGNVLPWAIGRGQQQLRTIGQGQEQQNLIQELLAEKQQQEMEQLLEDYNQVSLEL